MYNRAAMFFKMIACWVFASVTSITETINIR